MPEVILRTLMAGPDGVFQPGSKVDRPDGEELVRTGQAEWPKEAAAREAAQESARETATAEAPENAAEAPPRRRRSRGA